MEPPFDKLEALFHNVGHTGGQVRTYHYRFLRGTGHAESVQVLYDPKKVSYEKLLEVFWHNIDPIAKDRQFCDAGRNIAVPSSSQRRTKDRPNPAHNWKKLDRSKAPSSPRLPPHRRSIPPRNITRTTTSKTRSAISFTAPDAAATSD